MSKYVDRVLAELKEKNAHEAEFLQTAEEVFIHSGSGCRCTSGVREGWLFLREWLSRRELSSSVYRG